MNTFSALGKLTPQDPGQEPRRMQRRVLAGTALASGSGAGAHESAKPCRQQHVSQKSKTAT